MGGGGPYIWRHSLQAAVEKSRVRFRVARARIPELGDVAKLLTVRSVKPAR